MRVLMFGWEFPPHISGGLGTACYGLVKALLRQGVEVIFVVPKAFGDEDADDFRLVGAGDISIDVTSSEFSQYWKNLTYLEINAKLIPYVSFEEYRKLTHKAELEGVDRRDSIYNAQYQFEGKYGSNLSLEVSRYALVAMAIAQRVDFDVIHAHDWLTYPAGIAAKIVSGKPLVTHVHATEFDRSGEHVNQYVYDIERRGMHAADSVITVSHLTRRVVIDRYSVDPTKVVAIHNGALTRAREIVSEKPELLEDKIVTFLGRITFQKGPDYFVEAAAKVLKRVPNVRFVMAGSGDMLHSMIRRVAALRLGSRFHFTGFLSDPWVDRLLALSDVYVMPSVSEPFGIAPLEAMFSNVPVIISKQSGVAEVLHHAVKVNFWDVDAIADSIYGLLHYPALSRFFVRYGKQEVEGLQWDTSAAHVISVYNDLAQRRALLA